jgi:hypothetical protein
MEFQIKKEKYSGQQVMTPILSISLSFILVKNSDTLTKEWVGNPNSILPGTLTDIPTLFFLMLASVYESIMHIN